MPTVEQTAIDQVVENRIDQDPSNRDPSRRSRVTKKTVERQTQAAFGPFLWGSDFLWDSLAYQGFAFVIFCPLRNKVQALARKYRRRPQAFAPAFGKLVARYLAAKIRSDPGFRRNYEHFKYLEQKMQDYFKENVSENLAAEAYSGFRLPENLSQRQLIALTEIASKARRLFRGSVIEKEPKRFLATFTSLAAARPGPRPSPLAKRIHRIDQKARAEGSHLTYSAIAKKVFSQYKSSSGDERRHFRETVRLALRKK